MATFRKVRELLPTSFDDGDISEDEFLLLYDVNRSKNPDFPYQNYEHFDLERLDESECLAEFRFRKSDIPVLKEAVGLPDSYTCEQGPFSDHKKTRGSCTTDTKESTHWNTSLGIALWYDSQYVWASR